MDIISCKAHAKINLTLEVIGKRADGYHDLRMVMQSLALHDTLTIQKTASGLTMESDCPGLPVDESNLVLRAARALDARYGLPCGLHFMLAKRIPVAAGLAGGSADCAAALRGVRDLCGLGAGDDTLAEIGAGLGADVPYCLRGGSMLAEGIGDILRPLPPAPDCAVLLAKLPVAVSTAQVFRTYTGRTGGAPNAAAMCTALERGDLYAIGRALANDLESVTIGMHPQIADIKRVMQAHSAAGSLMSGSGPTVFGLFAEARAAETAGGALRVLYPDMAEIIVTSLA